MGSTVLFLNLGLGAAGLFLGNIINMASRIFICWHLEIKLHISFSKLVSEIKPSIFFMLTSIVLFVVSHKHYGFVLKFSYHLILRCLIAAILFATNLFPIVFENRKVII